MADESVIPSGDARAMIVAVGLMALAIVAMFATPPLVRRIRADKDGTTPMAMPPVPDYAPDETPAHPADVSGEADGS